MGIKFGDNTAVTNKNNTYVNVPPACPYERFHTTENGVLNRETQHAAHAQCAAKFRIAAFLHHVSTQMLNKQNNKHRMDAKYILDAFTSSEFRSKCLNVGFS